MIDADFAIIHKTRPAHERGLASRRSRATSRARSRSSATTSSRPAGTLLASATRSRKQGAKDVWVFATHGLFCDGALERFARERHRPASSSPTPCRSTRCAARRTSTVLTVSGLLAETIMNVFADDSVSAIFGGENQLF